MPPAIPSGMFRHPIVVGGGTPYLPPVTGAVPLELIETRTFGSHVVFERYGRSRGGPNQVPSASASPASVPSPTQAT